MNIARIAPMLSAIAVGVLCALTEERVVAPRAARQRSKLAGERTTAPSATTAGDDVEQSRVSNDQLESGMTRTLSGVALLEGGPRAANVDVFVAAAGDHLADVLCVETDARGDFVVDLPPGPYLISCSAGEYREYRDRVLRTVVPAVGPVPDLQIRLPARYCSWANVRLIDADDAPVVATVSGWRAASDGHVTLRFEDSAGVASITILEDDLLPDLCFQAVIETAEWEPGPQQVVRLPLRSSVRVTIVGTTGEELVASEVNSVDACGQLVSRALPRSSDGSLVLAYRHWPEHGIGLRVTSTAYAPWYHHVENPRAIILARLDPPASIAGRLVDHRGAPLHGWAVSCDGADVATNAGGRFHFGSLAAGHHEVRVYRPDTERGQALAFVQTDLEPGESGDVGDLVVPKLVVLTGKVVDDLGHAVAGATVLAWRPPSFSGGDTVTDAAGLFRLEVPATESWRFLVRHDSACSVVAACPPGVEVKVTLGPEARLHVLSSRKWDTALVWWHDMQMRPERVGDVLTSLPAGPLRIELWADDRTVATGDVEVVPGRTVVFDAD